MLRIHNSDSMLRIRKHQELVLVRLFEIFHRHYMDLRYEINLCSCLEVREDKQFSELRNIKASNIFTSTRNDNKTNK